MRTTVYKFPLRMLRVKLEEALLKIRHMGYVESREFLPSMKLDALSTGLPSTLKRNIREPDLPCYGAPSSNSPGERRFSVENFEISPGRGALARRCPPHFFTRVKVYGLESFVFYLVVK